GGAVGHADFAPDGEILVDWSDPSHQWRLIALDEASGRRTRTVLAEGEVPPGRPFRSVTLASSDGAEVQAWLGVPAGAGPFPAVLHMHGGPRRVQTAGFSPEGQAWLDHGVAYMSVNYRGSITF